MRHFRFTTRTIFILTAIVGVTCCLVKTELDRRIQEQNRIAVANREEIAKILHRCSGIPELKQFTDLYAPKRAVEFVKTETRVVSVCAVSCMTPINGRYDAYFHAPVEISNSGLYELNGKLSFSITDRKGRFKTIYKNGHTTSSTVRMNAEQWTRFVSDGSDFESLRTIDMPKRMGDR